MDTIIDTLKAFLDMMYCDSNYNNRNVIEKDIKKVFLSCNDILMRLKKRISLAYARVCAHAFKIFEQYNV